MTDQFDSMSGKDLAKLFSLDGAKPTWTDEDRRAVLGHQMSAPLLEELREVKGDVAIPDSRTDLTTFGDLLLGDNPPVHLLRLAKQLMKDRAGRSRDLFPKEVAGLLYVVSICAALVKCNENISENDNASLARRVDWALGMQWTDDATRELLEQGQSVLQ